ncbi:MAG: 4Fe-4S double cluster binding domain-containing protein [bacterium]
MMGQDIYPAPSGSKKRTDESLGFEYKYRTASVEHFREMQEYVDRLKREGKLSDNETYQSYIENKIFEVPEDFSTAKSIIVLATFTKLMFVNFHWKGKAHEVMLPPQYYDDGVSVEAIQDTIQKDIIKKPGYKVERAKKIYLKHLAVRSGLGKYGKNNICYVDEFGSFITLYAFLTDFIFEEDNWRRVEMMRACRRCTICVDLCPTGCFRKDNFVIDAGRCVTLYNEIQGNFPSFIPSDAHNALMGCMRCQWRCPLNLQVRRMTERVEDVTEEETRKILAGTPDKALLEARTKKLKGYTPATSEAYFPIFTRNLSVLIV